MDFFFEGFAHLLHKFLHLKIMGGFLDLKVMASNIATDSETLANNSESLNTLATEQSQLVAKFTL